MMLREFVAASVPSRGVVLLRADLVVLDIGVEVCDLAAVNQFEHPRVSAV